MFTIRNIKVELIFVSMHVIFRITGITLQSRADMELVTLLKNPAVIFHKACQFVILYAGLFLLHVIFAKWFLPVLNSTRQSCV